MLGNNLKTMRKKIGLSQEELAKKLDLSRSTYNSYEQDICEPPLDVLCKLTDVFNVSIDELIGHTQKKSSFTRDDLLDKISEFSKMLPDTDLCLILGRIMALVEKQEQGK